MPPLFGDDTGKVHMASISGEWIEVQVRCSFDAGELLALLDDPALPGAWQDGGTIHLYWPSDKWSPEQVTLLRQTLRRFAKEDVGEAEIIVRSLPHHDWNREWAQSVKPLRIGRRVVVRPSWEHVESAAGQIEIVLDPKQAFGTGHHATTSLLLEWLEDDIRGGESVLDVGTGSGLLAMVALRLGAARALAIDHDPQAIDCAREYAAVNGFGDELALQCGRLETDRRYDVVLANLDRRTLLELAQHLADSTGTTLIVSGLLLDQRAEIVSALTDAGLYTARERERDGWVAIEFTRPESCEA
jgi:ribosomal protein L11 methyltransferase